MWLLSCENLYHLYNFVRESQTTFLDSLQTFDMGATYIQLMLSLLTDSQNHTDITDTFNESSDVQCKEVVQKELK